MFVQRLLLLPLVAAFGLLAQVPTGSIEGRVTNAQTGDGIPSASVRLAPMRMAASGTGSSELTTTTGVDGSFHFDAVAPGTYFAVVESNGFVGSGSRPALRSVSVGAGQQVSNVAISLMPQATVSGKVVDDEGTGQAGARVEAFAEHVVRGKAQLFRVSQTTADKSGVYNVRGLSPGKYYLVAELSGKPPVKTEPKAAKTDGQPPMQLVRTYYPKSLDLDNAGTIDVQSGQDLSGTNIELRRVATHHIEGKVDGLSGAAAERDMLFLAPKAGIQSASFGRKGKVGADGRFVFDAVVPGEYTLRLIGSDPAAVGPRFMSRRHLLARQDVEVGASDVDGVDLAVIPPVTITGHVTMDGMDNPDFSQVHITLAPAADDFSFGSYQSVRVAADGSFNVAGLSPARYVVHAVGGPSRTYVKSLTFNGQDLLTHPMDLSEGGGGEMTVGLHSGVAEVDGTVQSSNQPSQTPLASPTGGQAASPFPMVVLMPAKLAPDGTGWLVGPVQPSGAFAFQNVRPGQYTAFAVERFDGTLWQNPDFVKEMQNDGISIDVGENDHKQVQLSAISNEEIQQAAARAGIQP